MQVKILSVVIRYVSDLFKTLEMCNKVVEENGGTLKFVPNSNKKKQTVDNYANALEYVPDSYKAQKMCYKAVDSNPSAIEFVPECFKTQEMCRKAVNSHSFYYVPYRYKTQKCVLLKCLLLILC